MNTKPMRLLRPDPRVTRQDIERARIEQSWREWSGPNGKPWTPYDGSVEPWTGKVSESVDKATYRVNLSEEIPLFRRILRFFRGIR